MLSHKMQKRILQVFTSVRDHTCVSYAKIATIRGFCDIDLTIVKATSPDDFLSLDKYVYKFLKIFSISPSSYRAFSLGFARRFGKTKSWRVALKCLVLLHRLLNSLPYNCRFKTELLWARTNGLFSLYPCNFRDSSSSSSEDYTTFIRSYARVLDEILDCSPIEITKRSNISDKNDNFPSKIKDLGQVIEVLPQLQSLIDRVMECRPPGVVSRNFLVQLAMKQVIRDSFTCYTTFRREVMMVLNNLIQLPYRNCVAAFHIYKKEATQADQLSQFHNWCKSMRYCGSYEYPFIDRIPEIQIQALEIFLNGMWQLTDQSSPLNISSMSDVQSPLSFMNSESETRVTRLETKCDQVKSKDVKNQVKIKDMDIEPLIQWEVGNHSDLGWEDLLEASINTSSYMDSRNNWAYGNYIQTPNPFYQQPHRINMYHGSCPTTPMHPWGL